MSTVLWILLLWCLVSIPAAIAIGLWIKWQRLPPH